jgi:hypothetical protein
MAAGAILPPLFFEQRRDGSIWLSEHGILKNTGIQEHPGNITTVDHAI